MLSLSLLSSPEFFCLTSPCCLQAQLLDCTVLAAPVNLQVREEVACRYHQEKGRYARRLQAVRRGIS